MKPPSRAALRPCARLSAKELALVRAIAASVNVRISSKRKPLLFSGTHATVAAEAMAKQLRRDLYRVDLSAVVSKYIGETEKNLDRIFAATDAADWILFFDEADALFGKRSTVKDSHDRYSAIEIDFLLQRIAEHHRLVVLASKPGLSLPIALRRRFSAYDFPPP